MSAVTIPVEVVYACPGRQTLLRLDVDEGTTVGRALAASGILRLHPEIDLAHQERLARRDLVGLGIAIVGRAALDDVADIDV